MPGKHHTSADSVWAPSINNVNTVSRFHPSSAAAWRRRLWWRQVNGQVGSPHRGDTGVDGAQTVIMGTTPNFMHPVRNMVSGMEMEAMERMWSTIWVESHHLGSKLAGSAADLKQRCTDNDLGRVTVSHSLFTADLIRTVWLTFWAQEKQPWWYMTIWIILTPLIKLASDESYHLIYHFKSIVIGPPDDWAQLVSGSSHQGNSNHLWGEMAVALLCNPSKERYLHSWHFKAKSSNLSRIQVNGKATCYQSKEQTFFPYSSHQWHESSVLSRSDSQGAALVHVGLLDGR